MDFSKRRSKSRWHTGGTARQVALDVADPNHRLLDPMSKNQAADKPKHLPQFVGYREVQDALGVSRRTVERMVREGKFPKPIQLTPNRVGWRLETVQAWLAEREKGLSAKAVTNPEDLSPDQLGDAAVDLLTRAIEHEIGEPVDPKGIQITYGPPPEMITLDQLKSAEARQLAMLWRQLADFPSGRAYVMAAYLFPNLRPMFAEWAAHDGLRPLFRDDERLRELALDAMNEVSWQEAVAKVAAIKAGR